MSKFAVFVGIFCLPIFHLFAAVDVIEENQFVQFEGFSELLCAHESELWDGYMQSILAQQKNEEIPQDFIIVAIDGGAGSGKTSTARAVAKMENFAFVSTGDHYRILAHYLSENAISANDSSSLQNALSSLRLATLFRANEAHLSLDGTILEKEVLHNGKINDCVADYAQNQYLRKFLCNYQRQLPLIAHASGFHGMVMEGRDIGNVVFPDAHLRIFLDANLDVRKRRRQQEGIEDDVIRRDQKDQVQLQRTPDGTIFIDSTNLSLEEVIMLIGKELS